MTQLAQQRNLVVYKVVKTKVKVKIPILLNGKVLDKVDKLTATWIDPETLETFTEKQARSFGYPAFDYGIMILQRDYILSRLRPETRAFAEFVLKFRNGRRGLTPSIWTLCTWYAQYSGKRSDNIRRSVQTLIDVGILSADNPDVLMPLFQINNRKAGSTEYLSEMFVAKNKFAELMRRK